MRRAQIMMLLSVVMLLAGAGVLAGCNDPEKGYPVASGGDARAGKSIIAEHHCGDCHTIPGISSAHGVVGPPLELFGRRTLIAGEFPNEPDVLVRWIISPPAMKPKTAMPELGLSPQQSRDIAAYLYTLR